MAVKRFKIEKLVRDYIPKKLMESDIQIDNRRLNSDDYIAKLKDKLVEEAEEVITAPTKESLTIEFADLMEVIRALAKASSISLEEIEEARRKKLLSSGGFEEGLYLHHVAIDELNPAIHYYSNQPDRYPAVETE